MEESLFNVEKESSKSIKWILKQAQNLFKDNKNLILSNPILCPIRQLQALTMNFVLPSYVELTNSLASMAMVFELNDRLVAKKECERLIQYLVFYRKED